MVKVTRSQSLNECDYYLSLLEISLGQAPYTLEISNQGDDLKIVHMKYSKIRNIQTPFNIIVDKNNEENTEINIQRIGDMDDVKLLVYHKSEKLNITNHNAEYCDIVDSNLLRIRYAEEQPVHTISHNKQDECLHLLEKATDIYGLNKINILYVGPDELLNVKSILNYLIEEKGIKKEDLILDVATSNVIDTKYCDLLVYADNEIEGVKIRDRIPHTSDIQPTPKYDLIVDCFTFPLWHKKENEIKVTLQHRMSSLKPSGYFLFVTPSSTKDSIFFPSDDEDYEDLFKKNWPSSDDDLSQKMVLQRPDSIHDTNIYSTLIQAKQTNACPIATQNLAVNIDQRVVLSSSVMDRMKDLLVFLELVMYIADRELG